MKDLRIRKANESDAAAIAAILRQLGWFTPLNTATPEQVVRQVEQHIQLCHTDRSHSIYVAEPVSKDISESVSENAPEKESENVPEKVSSAVLGYIAVHWLPYLFLASPEGYISELFVHSDYYGRGIGQCLLNMVLAEAADRGCSRLMLVNSKNRESYQRRFYVKQGWQERDNVANFVYPLSHH